MDHPGPFGFPGGDLSLPRIPAKATTADVPLRARNA